MRCERVAAVVAALVSSAVESLDVSFVCFIFLFNNSYTEAVVMNGIVGKVFLS